MPEKGVPGLPDYVAPGMRVLFVGINPGLRSAQLGHHFAGHSNRFWKLLADSKLIPIPLTYQDDFRLLEWGIGLTNLVARPTAGIHELSTQEYREGRTILFKMIEVYRPQIIALLGLGIT
ncbi:MAG: mismatch-specific DNA-glycosylase, partial [Nitrospira sp.]|nr:mismatch-specific DNA-glycosylase [Nitrospira sp.]